MLRLATAICFLCSFCLMGESQAEFRLKAPAGWGGETISLPPTFAKSMKLTGVEHIRFAPGMMDPNSDSFFSYAFAFELNPTPKLTAPVVREEFLTYYRGLCKAVMNGVEPELPLEKFAIALTESKAADTLLAPKGAISYSGTLLWVEPFATKKTQTLNLEIQTWQHDGRNYVFACVSPEATDAAIWAQLHKIRDGYRTKSDVGR